MKRVAAMLVMLASPAIAQVAPAPPSLGALPGAPSYTPPSYAPPTYTPPGYAPPSLTPVLPDPDAPPPAPPPPAWLQRGSADLQALDKVTARSAALHVRVGETAKFGALSIAVGACVVRPPDQPADAAARLTIADAHPNQPGFDGWMLLSAPQASMLEHPIYDVRVTGCGA